MSAVRPPTFTHSGYRYVLGFTDDAYAIWDRTAPRAPVERFRRTSDAWPQAWSRFRELEPQAVPLAAGRPPRSAGDAAPAWSGRVGRRIPLVSPASIARAVMILLALTIPANALLGLARIAQVGLIERARRGEEVLRSDALAADRMAAAALALSVLVSLATAGLWLIWQHRSHRNLRAARVPGLRFTAGWSVGWWFVPLANLVQVPRALRELWLASEARPGEDWRRGRTPALLVVWWVALMVPAAVSAATAGPVQDLDGLRRLAAGQMWSSFASIPAAALAVPLVRAITRRNAALAARPAGPGPTPEAPDRTEIGHRSPP